MRFSNLNEWLDWQQTLHPLPMELKLERVERVAGQLDLLRDVPTTVTVAGTNGKGTVATAVAALLTAMGYRVGLYTSPHLFRYNERIAIAGTAVGDDELCHAFAAVDAARGEQSLTFFEFGTLAAVLLFRQAAVDVQVLEVGLGGRGDAVNVWDADYPVITSVDLDHEAWLGPDREAIGAQKAGILRRGRCATLGDRDPPRSVLAAAAALSAPVQRLGPDFGIDFSAGAFRLGAREYALPADVLTRLQPGSARADNLATALATLHAMNLADRLTPEVLHAGLTPVAMGRQVSIPGHPEWLLDVAHNPQAARELRRWLDSQPLRRPVVALFGIMADKNIEAVVAPLVSHVDHWVTLTLPGRRACAAERIAEWIAAQTPVGIQIAADMAAAVALARDLAGAQGRIVAFGSFITVQLALEALDPDFSASTGVQG
jgi:dihydrofolate synthase/folylpolyglutamate synthase